MRRRDRRRAREAQRILDKGERAAERTAIVGHERVRRAPRGASQGRLLEVQRDGLGERVDVEDLARRTALERHGADLFEVEHVRPEHDGHVHCARLEQILAAVRHQTAANERDVGGGVEPLQLAHRVPDEHLGAVRQCARRAATQRDGEPAPPAEPRDRLEALGMPRHEHEQQVRIAALKLRVRRENLALLSRVRARRDPDGPLAAPVHAQRTCFLEQRRRQLDVELEIARHVNELAGRAEIAQPLRVDARLRAQQVGIREHRARDVWHSEVPAQRCLRHSAVH